jgi:uncharacterized protein YwgA
MIDDLKKMIAALKYWGLTGWNPPRSYQHRFLLQKITFICKSLGFDLPSYDFSIYLNGPYSPPLAKDYYQHEALLAKSETDHVLDEKEMALLDVIHSAVFLNQKMRTNQGEFLEAVSTILYLKNCKNLADDDVVFSETKRIKPHLGDSIIVIGVNVAKKLLFKP